MKKFFDFTMTGKEMFPYWMLYLITVIFPYFFFVFFRQYMPHVNSAMKVLAVLGIVFFVAAVMIVLTYYFIKIYIRNIQFGGEQMQFTGKLSTYLEIMVPGIVLTIITLGFYFPWWRRDLTRFFAESSIYKTEKFSFQGKGNRLLVIYLLGLVLPYIIFIVIVTIQMLHSQHTNTPSVLFRSLIYLVLIPFYYFYYNWMMNIRYKGYHIRWNTSFWPSFGKILQQFVLSIVTLGIYIPMAYIKLYEYFTDRTIAESETGVLCFGYNDIDAADDFLMFWGQILLSIVTLGIYFPWAAAKIGKRFLIQTYVQEKEIVVKES